MQSPPSFLIVFSQRHLKTSQLREITQNWYFLVAIATSEAGGQWSVCEEEEEGAVQRQSIWERETNSCPHQRPAKVRGHVIIM